MVKQSSRIFNAQLIISNLEGKKKEEEDETPTDGAGDKFTGFVEKKSWGERRREKEWSEGLQ